MNLVEISMKDINYRYDITDFCLRLATKQDIEGLYNLSKIAQPGLTSIPRSKHEWASRIEKCHQIMNSPEHNNQSGTWYIFVLEHMPFKEIVGTAAILDSCGTNQPILAYQIETLKQISSQLQIKQNLKLLKQKKLFNGPTSLGALLLHPKCRQLGLGRFLTVSRLLFICENKNKFKNRILSELRGYLDENGSSPFWKNVGYPIFGIPYALAERMIAQNNNFINELLPKIPIIINTLPQYVQDCIGKCHRYTQAAYQILQSEGFKTTRSVDVLDAGPKVVINIKKLRMNNSIKSAHINLLEESTLQKKYQKKDFQVIISSKSKTFSLQVVNAPVNKNKIQLTKHQVKKLKLDKNDNIHYISLYPPINNQTFNKEFWACYQKAALLFKTRQ